MFNIEYLEKNDIPDLLKEIPDKPTTLNYRGQIGKLFEPNRKSLTVVGSRRYTPYGRQVVETLIGGLSGYPINIISGLALGIDSLAHQVALKSNLYTVAVPGSGINDQVIYPRSHLRLAHQIMTEGGALLSEYPPDTRAARWTFPQRNRLMAGLSEATLIIEATEKSGTLITARLATDYDRELLVVPGDIFRASSMGCNQFIKLGARVVTEAADILDSFNLLDSTTEKTNPTENLSPEAKRIWDLLTEPTERDELIRKSGLNTETANTLLMQLVIEDILINDDDYFRRNI